MDASADNSEQRCDWCKMLIGRTDETASDIAGEVFHRECYDFMQALAAEQGS